jgi:hypothetical protein
MGERSGSGSAHIPARVSRIRLERFPAVWAHPSFRPTACRAAAVQIRTVILWVMLATIYSNSESVSAQFEPSLRRIDADIENRDSETRSRISPGAAQNAESRHNRPRDIPPTDGNVACFLTTIPRLSSRLTWSRRNYLRSPRIVAARLSRLKSKARPAERHLGVLWKPQRFVQLRIVKNVPEMIDDLAISPKLIRKHKLDRSQHECEKCVVAVQQRGFYRRRTDEIA